MFPSRRLAPELAAILLVLLACAFFAGTNLIAKIIAEFGAAAEASALEAGGEALRSLHPFQLAFGRFLFGSLMLTPLVAWRGIGVLRSKVPYVYLLRGSGSVGSITCIFIAVAALPLADVTALTYSSPFFTLVLAAILLKETVGRQRWIAVAVGFAGVLVMTQPTSGAFQPLALVALLAAVFMSVEVTAIRYVAQYDPASTALLLTNLFGLAISGLVAPFVWQTPSLLDWFLMASIGVVTVTGQIFFVRAAGMADASLFVPYFYSTLIYAAIYGYLIFAEIPTLPTLLGSALIVGAGVYLARRSAKTAA